MNFHRPKLGRSAGLLAICCIALTFSVAATYRISRLGNDGRTRGSDRGGAAAATTIDRGEAASDNTQGSSFPIPVHADRKAEKSDEAGQRRPLESRRAEALIGQTESKESQAITFRCLSAVTADSQLTLLISDRTSLALQEFIVEQGKAITATLPHGDYQLRAIAGLATGQTIDFSVPSITGEVSYAPPAPYAAEWPIIDAESDEPLLAARMSLVLLSAPSIHETATVDHIGIARFPSVSGSTYRVKVTCEGYNAHEQEFDFGPWLETSTRTRTLRLSPFRLTREEIIEVRIVNYSHLGPSAEFRVAHTHEGKKLPFTPAGVAFVPVGEDYHPLYLKLFHPDGIEEILYIEESARNQNGNIEIDLSGRCLLNVDLRTSSVIDSALASGNGYVQATLLRSPGVSAQLNRAAEHQGVYTFPCPPQKPISVALSIFSKGTSTTVSHRLVRTGSTDSHNSILNAQALPPATYFVFHDSDPLPANSGVELRLGPDLTSWIAGGQIRPDSSFSLPDVDDGSCFLTLYDSASTFAIDVPYSSRESDNRVAIGAMAQRTIQLLVDDAPAPDTWIELHGGETRSASMGWFKTNSSGKVNDLRLSTLSRATLQIDNAANYWPPLRRFRVEQDLTTMQLWSTGSVVIRDRALASTVRFKGKSPQADSVDAWIRTFLTEQDGEGLTLRIPAGAYSFATSDGHELSLVLNPGTIVQLDELAAKGR